AETGATAALPRTLVEAVEDVRRVGGGDAGARVADTHDDRPLRRPAALDRDGAFRGGVLHGVHEEIREDAHDEAVVDEHLLVRGDARLESDLAGERLGRDL